MRAGIRSGIARGLVGTTSELRSIVRLAILVSAGALVVSCGTGGATGTSCSTQLEADMNTAFTNRALSGASDTTDPFYYPFSFVVQRHDGRRYNFNWGGSTLQTSYESASTSKLVSAVIILRQVEQNHLALSDKPQDWILSWSTYMPTSDPLYNLTLAQLLSFTSGLQLDPACLNLGGSDFETCVDAIAHDNAGHGYMPGTDFYYASTHLQVAGLMAVKARGFASWQDLFSEFQMQTGLFPHGAYDLPSSTNPRLAGGMHWTAEEYMAFLEALQAGSLLDSTSMNELLADQTSSVTMANSPPLKQLGENWHYGFGLWHECQNATFNCAPGVRVSSPGAYGSYPFWDRSKNYFGMVARQEALGNFTDGVAIERFIRPKVEQWVACQ